jgi:hypothetical protein
MVKDGNLRNSLGHNPLKPRKIEKICVEWARTQPNIPGKGPEPYCVAERHVKVINSEFFDEVEKYLGHDPGVTWGDGVISANGGASTGPEAGRISMYVAYQGGTRSLTIGQTQGMLEACTEQFYKDFRTARDEYRTCRGGVICRE